MKTIEMGEGEVKQNNTTGSRKGRKEDNGERDSWGDETES